MARGRDGSPEVTPARKSKELVLASLHNASVPLFDVVYNREGEGANESP